MASTTRGHRVLEGSASGDLSWPWTGLSDQRFGVTAHLSGMLLRSTVPHVFLVPQSFVRSGVPGVDGRGRLRTGYATRCRGGRTDG